MAILLIVEQPSECSENDQWERSGLIGYRVAATVDWSTVNVRKNLGSGFAINIPHPDDAGMVIVGISCKRDFELGPSRFADADNPADPNTATPCFWYDVTCTYGPWNPLEHTATGNPVDQPLGISFQWTVGEQPCDVAVTGKNPDGSYIYSPVINSAGCPFDPSVTRDELRCLIRVSQNVLTYSPSAEFNLGNCINNDSSPLWNNFSPYTVKWTPPDMPAKLYSQFLGQVYYRLDHAFNFNPQGWNATPIDRGTTALNASGQLYKVVDQYGQPVSEPVLLDGSGHELANPTAANIKSFNYQTCNDISFVNTFGVAFQDLFPTS